MFWAQVQPNYAQFAISKLSTTLCLKYQLTYSDWESPPLENPTVDYQSFVTRAVHEATGHFFARGRAVVTATQPQNHLLPAARSAKRSVPEVQFIKYMSFIFLMSMQVNAC